MSNEFMMQPDAVVDAMTRLGALADRVDELLTREAPSLTVNAAGRDEVSARTAATMNAVHASFVDASGHGTKEMRDITSTVTTHATDLIAAEQDFVV